MSTSNASRPTRFNITATNRAVWAQRAAFILGKLYTAKRESFIVTKFPQSFIQAPPEKYLNLFIGIGRVSFVTKARKKPWIPAEYFSGCTPVLAIRIFQVWPWAFWSFLSL